MTETVTVALDRSSVAAGDDVESHRVLWNFPGSATVDDLLVGISGHYLPTIAGPAGWVVGVRSAGQIRRLDLGIIYTRDDLEQQDQVCRLVPGTTTLGDLVRQSDAHRVDVYARYLTRDMVRPSALIEVTSGPAYSGVQPIELESEAGPRGA
jgi:hypothetical protein